MMKTGSLFSLLCIWVSIGTAQVTKIDTIVYPTPVPPKAKTTNFNTDYLYTVAVKAYGYEQFPQLLNQPSGQPYHTSYLNGLLFKLNDNQIAYRLQAAHFRDDISFDNECEGCETATGKLKNTMVKVGAEKNINYSRVQPYFGADLGFMIQRFDGETTQAKVNEEGENEVINKFYADQKNAALFSPFVGIKFYIVPKVALGAEANFNIAYTYQKNNQYADSGRSGAPEQTKRYRWEYFFAPVAAITLQYNFGLVNQ